MSLTPDILWKNTFMTTLSKCECAEPLKEAALIANLGVWTKELTDVVVKTCKDLGLHPASKGNKCSFLPILRSEYLSIDVMAFRDNPGVWRLPSVVIELENSLKDDIIAYSLWKVLCIQTQLRIVFCYRRNPEDGSSLIQFLQRNVITPIPIDERMRFEGQTLISLGSRNEASTFPYGFFKWWRLNKNIGKFELI